jgi:hypothetical protein
VLIMACRAKAVREWYSVVIFCSCAFIWEILAFGLLWPNRNHGYFGARYFYAYWADQLLNCALKLLILWQILIAALGSYKALPVKPAVIYAGVTSVVAGISAYSGFVASTMVKGSFRHLASFAMASNRAGALAYASVTAMFVIWSGLLGLKWRSRALLIDLGLTSMTLSEVVWSVLRTYLPPVGIFYHAYINVVFYIVSLGIWTAAFHIKEPHSSTSPEIMIEIKRLDRELTAELQTLRIEIPD